MTVSFATSCYLEELLFVVLSSLSWKYKNISVFATAWHFPFKNGNIEKQDKVGSRCKKSQEEHPRNGQSRNTSFPIINEECITQVFEEIEGRVAEKIAQEFSRTESRILGALSKLEEFLVNPQVRTQSGTIPGTSRNTGVENQEPHGYRSQNDPHPEMGSSVYQSHTSVDSDPEEAPHTILKKKQECNLLFWKCNEICFSCEFFSLERN